MGGSSVTDSTSVDWIRHFASGLAPSNDQATAVALDNAGNIYVTGSSTGPFTQNDFATVKFDASGSQQWVARYNSPHGDDYAAGIGLDSLGNVYVTGTGSGSIVTIKYNGAGIQQWVALYGGNDGSNSYASALAVDSSGNVYVTGVRNCNVVTIKYNTAGLQEWDSRYFGDGSCNWPAAIVVDTKGNVFVTGGSDCYATIKYNAAGVEQWIRLYDSPEWARAHALAVDMAGNVYVTGESYQSSNGSDYVTIKYNMSGTQEWITSYSDEGAYSYDSPSAIGVDQAGNVYVTGLSSSSDTTMNCATVKYNSAGVEQWVVRYNGDSFSSALDLDTLGNVYVSGGSGHIEWGWGSYLISDSILTMKYDSNGVLQWVARHNGPGNFETYASALAVDGSGNVHVVGVTSPADFESDYATIKYSTSGVELWSQHYSGPGNNWDVATGLATDESGNVFVTGSSVGPGSSTDYVTIKYDETGVQQWVARFDGVGSGYDSPSAMKVDNSGNVYVTGQSQTSDSTWEYATVKYNSAGTEQWVAYYSSAGYSAASSLAIDRAGNVYVTGSSIGSETSYDYATTKYNSVGIQMWAARYNGPGNLGDYAKSVDVDSGGNVFVTGTSQGDILTVKYNSSGIEQWSKRYKGDFDGNWEQGTALAVDAMGNIFVVGDSWGIGTYQDFLTIKYDNLGNLLWVSRYNGPANYSDGATDLEVDHAGNAYVTGWSESPNAGSDYVTIKYDNHGTQQWVARYNGSQDQYDYPRDLTLDQTGKTYVTGSSGDEYATVAYDAMGNQQWSARYNGPANSWGEAVAVGIDNSGNVFVTGSRGEGNWSMYATIRYNQALSAPSVEVLSPNGGESWEQGTKHEIRWSKKGGVDTVRIEYATNGTNWTLISPGVPAALGKFVWNVPNIFPAQARVRISWKDSVQISDENDGWFNITAFSAGPWIHAGSDMGPIWSIVVDPSDQRIMYAGSNISGMWKSPDGGFTWRQINNGLWNLTVQVCDISRSNPNILYCGTSSLGDSSGVYKSTNAGSSWSLINSGITESPIGVQALAVDPTNPDIAFVAAWDLLLPAVDGIFKTTNGGANWFASNSGIGPVRNFLSFGINPLNPKVIYAGSSFMFGVTDTNQARVYKSYDGGETWTDASSGLPQTQGKWTHNPVRSLSIDRADTSRILAGVFLNDTSGGAFLTTNGGTSWEKIHNGLPNTVGAFPRSVLIRPGSTGEYYIGFGQMVDPPTNAGVYRTTNAGQNWEEFNANSLPKTTTVRALAFRTFGGDALFAGGAHTFESGGQGLFMYQFTPTAVEHKRDDALPQMFALHQNYPNPFNPTTKIRFMIPNSQFTSLKIYDLLSREVATLVDEEMKPGSYEVTWDASGLPSGVYFYRLATERFVETKKLLLLR